MKNSFIRIFAFSKATFWLLQTLPVNFKDFQNTHFSIKIYLEENILFNFKKSTYLSVRFYIFSQILHL